MSLLEQISNDMKEAMKAKNDATLSTLRLLKSALKNKQIDLMHELSEQEIQDVIKTQVKQLKDAMDQFATGGRSDLAESNQREIDLLKTYLPAELSDEELTIMVQEALAQSGAASKADMGKAMGFVMKVVAGRADGSRVKALLESLLMVCAFVFVTSEIMSPIPVHAEIGIVQIPGVGSFTYTPYLDLGLRFVRVLLLWGGLFCLNAIVHGSIEMSTGGTRDVSRHHAEHQILHGFVGIAVAIAGFCVATVFLQRVVS